MPETVTITKTLYKFPELSDSAKRRAIQDHLESDPLGHYEWWDCVKEDWKEKLGEMGYSDIDIRFSGFWSQGDGASFTGTCAFTLDHLAKRFPEIYTALCASRLKGEIHFDPSEIITAAITRIDHGHAHEHTVSCGESCIEAYFNDQGKDSINVHISALECEAEVAITEEVRDLSRDIYSDLEREYDYLTSEEQVSEHLTINEYTFNKEGEIE